MTPTAKLLILFRARTAAVVPRQDIIFSLPFPVYVNETAVRQSVVMSTYLNETTA